jgi:hypothetical protein
MRVSELVNLKEANVEVGRLQLKVLGKGNKERIIPMHKALAENGTLGVSYGNIVGVLIEAIKEQQAQIDKLKKQVA